MATYVAWQNGSATDKNTWAKVVRPATIGNTGTAINATKRYSNTLTANNTTDPWRGVYISFNSFNQGSVIQVDLEYNSTGSTWTVVSSVTFYCPTTFTYGSGRWLFLKFTSPYTPVTTTANKYRFSMVRTSGGGNSTAFGTSTTVFNAMAVTTAPATAPTKGDDVLINGVASQTDESYTPITVTVDADWHIGSNSVVNNHLQLPGTINNAFPAIDVGLGGRLKAHRTNSFRFVLASQVVICIYDGIFDFGTPTDRLQGNVQFLLDNRNFSVVGDRMGARFYGTQKDEAPYLLSFAGKDKTYINTKYVSGNGSTASPLEVSDPVDWEVGDQIQIGNAVPWGTVNGAQPELALSNVVYYPSTDTTRAYMDITFVGTNHNVRVGDRIQLYGFTPAVYNNYFSVDDIVSATTVRSYDVATTFTQPTKIGNCSRFWSGSEVRYIKTKISPTKYVLKTVSDDPFEFAHVTDNDVVNLTRNLTMAPLDNTRNWTADSPVNTSYASKVSKSIIYDSVRTDKFSSYNSYSLGFVANGYTAGLCSARMYKTVHWNLGGSLFYDSATTHSEWDINYNIITGVMATSQPAFTMNGYNKTIRNTYCFNQVRTVSAGSNVTVRNINAWSCGLLAANTYGLIYLNASAVNNRIVNSNIQGCGYGQTCLVEMNNGVDTYFANTRLGDIVMPGRAEIFITTGTFNTAVFENCKFGTTTPVNNYLNQIDGSLIAFHKFMQTDRRHRWYKNTGMAQSTGVGMSDTTVRVPGTWNLRLMPENNDVGFSWEFQIPSNVNQQTFLNGFLRKNTALGSGLAKVELWLPGSDTTDTPDALFTMDNTVNEWRSFSVNKVFNGAVPALSTIRITAVSNTPGAYLYVADLYNSADALNLWDKGRPVTPIVPTSFAAIPGLVWSYPKDNQALNTMGDLQVQTGEILSNTDATQAKVDGL